MDRLLGGMATDPGGGHVPQTKDDRSQSDSPDQPQADEYVYDADEHDAITVVCLPSLIGCFEFENRKRCSAYFCAVYRSLLLSCISYIFDDMQKKYMDYVNRDVVL